MIWEVVRRWHGNSNNHYDSPKSSVIQMASEAPWSLKIDRQAGPPCCSHGEPNVERACLERRWAASKGAICIIHSFEHVRRDNDAIRRNTVCPCTAIRFNEKIVAFTYVLPNNRE